MDIKQWRLKLDMTQEQLSRFVGVSTGTISMWENGVAEPKPKHVDRMKRIFQIEEDK